MERIYRLEVRLNQEEYTKLKEGMEKSNLPQSTYLRKLIMGVQIEEALPRDYYKLCTEVSRIGNNINQLARIANANPGQEVDFQKVRYLLYEILSLLVHKSTHMHDEQ